MAMELISSRARKQVYRDGDQVIKVFSRDSSKTEALNEAIVTARIEELEDIHVPHILAVSVIDGKWAITKEFIEGKTLKELLLEHPEETSKYLEQMVDLQLLILSKRCPYLNHLGTKTARQIKEASELTDAQKYDLLSRLDEMPRHTKLCHGDFCPANIIVTNDGKLYLLDWVHATQGNASADAARTYLLFCLDTPELADPYLELFCQKSGIARRYVESWLPLVTAAQLSKQHPEETENLKHWLEVFDKQF